MGYVKVSDPWVIWVQFLKITCLHFFTFLYLLLIILIQKKSIWYLCIWPFEFLKYYDKVNRALERGVWKTILFYSYTPHVSYIFGNLGTQGGDICTLKPIWYLCIWPFEFLKYHDKVNRALERGVWKTILFYSYTPHVSYIFGNLGTQGGDICTLKSIWASCYSPGPP